MKNYHATVLSIAGHGLLIMGSAGIGKSDLALRLLARGATLIADDQTWLEAVDGELMATAPETTAGMLEVRGVGITHLPAEISTKIDAVFTLVPAKKEERLPEPQTIEIEGVRVSHYCLSREAPSVPEKVLLVMAEISGQDILGIGVCKNGES